MCVKEGGKQYTRDFSFGCQIGDMKNLFRFWRMKKVNFGGENDSIAKEDLQFLGPYMRDHLGSLGV